MRKYFIILGLMVLCLFSISIYADSSESYLNASEYQVDVEASDVTASVQSFLTTCKNQKKNAFFPKGIYRFDADLYLIHGVDILGEEGTVFQAVTKQRYITSKVSVNSIKIEHIIFDNMSIWCKQGSSGWEIRYNGFIHASDVDVSMGCKPDSNGKNGGPATGYYIHNNRGSMTVESNMFLRDAQSLGRGIATYYSENVVIQDNYFGRLEDVESSIVSEKTKALKSTILSTNLIDEATDQGYFMTGINILNSDVNAKIIGNYMSFNTHITEAQYEDGSQSTKGYNRDHFIYAKAFQGLDIVGNYFKGMNKNQDGGIKCRNGEDLLIHKNVLEDTLILLYVQNDATGPKLKNVEISENIFINKDFSKELVQIPYGNNQMLNKYLTVDYSILFLNYVSTAEVDSISITSNLYYSDGLANEQIRIDNGDIAYHTPTNIYIEDNKNILGEPSRITIRRFSGKSTFLDTKQDWNNGSQYTSNRTVGYKDILVEKLASIKEIPYTIEQGKIKSFAEKIYVNGVLYQEEALPHGEYQIFLSKASTNSILVEDTIKTVPSHLYTIDTIEIKDSYTLTFDHKGHGKKPDSLKDLIYIPKELPILAEEGYTFEGWYMDEALTEKAVANQALYKDIVLYAKWTRVSYTVSFDASDIEPVQVYYNEKLSKPNEPIREGYTFEGWYKDKECKIPWNFTVDVVYETITLYPKWISNPYKITFNACGHGITPPQEETYEKLPILLPQLEEAGYTFEGWYIDEAYTTKAVPGARVEMDIILYAKWVKKIYKVYFAYVDIDPVPIGYNEKVVQPENPTQAGFIFEGWYKEKECQTRWNFDEDVITKNTTLYPKWIKQEAPKPALYIVEFQTKGGSPIASQEIQEGAKAVQPIDPTQEGYTFEGWYKDEKYQEKWSFEEAVTKDITLYAKWERVTPVEVPAQNHVLPIISIAVSLGIGIIGICILVILVIKKKKS